ncbi:MAG: hypothetical protein IPK58_18060 [Acidobacteria bacterium]|nr:hypothetical protein [Acidobacteriota bacterium]
MKDFLFATVSAYDPVATARNGNLLETTQERLFKYDSLSRPGLCCFVADGDKKRGRQLCSEPIIRRSAKRSGSSHSRKAREGSSNLES